MSIIIIIPTFICLFSDFVDFWLLILTLWGLSKPWLICIKEFSLLFWWSGCGSTDEYPYNPTYEICDNTIVGQKPGKLMSISSMKVYNNKSHEELRSEKYQQQRNKGNFCCCLQFFKIATLSLLHYLEYV